MAKRVPIRKTKGSYDDLCGFVEFEERLAVAKMAAQAYRHHHEHEDFVKIDDLLKEAMSIIEWWSENEAFGS